MHQRRNRADRLFAGGEHGEVRAARNVTARVALEFKLLADLLPLLHARAGSLAALDPLDLQFFKLRRDALGSTRAIPAGRIEDADRLNRYAARTQAVFDLVNAQRLVAHREAGFVNLGDLYV